MTGAPVSAVPNRRSVVLGGFSTLALAGCGMARNANDKIKIARRPFPDLAGWADADHDTAFRVFSSSLPHAHSRSGLNLTKPGDWAAIADTLATSRFSSARAGFEALFTPVEISTGTAALFTGYYEPQLRVSRKRGGPFQVPIYGKPHDLGDAPYLTRAEIVAGDLNGRADPIFWADDPVDVFFLEIQGSGRVVMPDGTLSRVGFAAKNNHPYRAIGKILVDRGEMALGDVSAQSLKAYLKRDPVRGQALMNENPSYVFFTERAELDAATGPIGAMGLPVSAGYSVAVDPAIYPLGSPIWINADTLDGFSARLMIAQDVGGAIKGAQRADLFIGSGDAAGEIAGMIRATGQMVALLPNGAANRLLASS